MQRNNEGLPLVWPFVTYKGVPLPESQRQRQRRFLQRQQREQSKQALTSIPLAPF
jgi:hypothetical protein